MTIKRITTIPLFTAMIIVFTVIVPPIPLFGNVSLTLQTLFVILAGLLLSPIDAFLSVLLYVIIGIMGFPVFSGYRSGFGTILAPTGGFILMFPIVAYLISYFNKKEYTFVKRLIISLVFGIIVLYLVATIWMDYYVARSYKEVVLGMLIFVPIDIVKAVLASLISIKLKNYV